MGECSDGDSSNKSANCQNKLKMAFQVTNEFVSTYIVAGFCLSPNRATAFGRRPLAVAAEGRDHRLVSSKLCLRHNCLMIFKLWGPLGVKKLMIFWDPSGFSILYLFVWFWGVRPGSSNSSFLNMFFNFRDSPFYSLCWVPPSARMDSKPLGPSTG